MPTSTHTLPRRPIKITGRAWAWSMISAAVFVLGVRQLMALIALLFAENPSRPDFSLELVEFAISLLMLFGLIGVIPLFRSIRDANDESLSSKQLLQKSERMLQSVLDTVPARVFWKDRELRFLGCNMHFARDAGLDSPQDIVGMDDFQLVWSEQAELYRSDDRQVMESGEPKINYEEPQSQPDGTQLWLRTNKIPLTDKSGNIYGVLGTYEDISDLKRIENERQELEAQLQQAQKMEAVGHLTGGVAHDFNNSLGAILGNIELVKDCLRNNTDTELDSYIENALSGVQRGASLTQRLLAFSRKQMLRPVPLDVNRLIREMHDLLVRTLGESIEIESICFPKLWMTIADKAQIENVLLNLVLNSRDSMPRGGKLTIETENSNLDESDCANFSELKPGQYILLAVTDTGTGIKKEIMEHIFEPFFTTKKMGEGSGLGLSMVYGFAKQSGGHVNVYSKNGQGTKVNFYLPRYMGDESLSSDKDPITVEKAHDETVLVVEDDPSLLTLNIKQLKGLGYAVLSAENGNAALQVFAEHPEIDLLYFLRLRMHTEVISID